MMRLVAALVVAWLAGMADAQLPSSISNRVSFRHVPARIPKLLADLGPELGVPLRSAPFFENEVMAIRVDGVTGSELLTKIAEVASGQWRFIDGNYVLTKDGPKIQAEERAERDRQREIFAAAQKIARERLAARVDDAFIREHQKKAGDLAKLHGEYTPSQYRQWRSLALDSPLKRAAMRLLTKLDPKQVTSLPRRKRIVYSNQPTAMQVSIDGDDVLRSLALEQEHWGTVGDLNIAGVEEETLAPSNSQRKPMTRLLLSVTNYGNFGGSCSLMLVCLSSDGTVQCSTDLSVNDLQPERDEPKATAVDSDQTPLPLSPFSAKLAALRQSRSGKALDPATWAAPEPEILNRLTHPEDDDPLDEAYSDGLLALAERRKLNLVALLEDRFVGYRPAAGHENLTAADIERVFRDRLTTDGSWAIVRPRNPVLSRLERTNRRDLGTLVRSVAATGRVPLVEYGQFLRGNQSMTLADELIGCLAKGVESSLYGMGDEDALRLYASLTPAQQRSFDRGGKIEYSGLNAEQRDLVDLLTFGNSANLQQSVVDQTERVEATPESGFGFQDPTDLLPRGIPRTTLIGLDVSESPIIMGYESEADDEGWGSDGQPIEGLASLIYFRAHPELFPWASDYPSYDVYHVATRRELTIQITYHASLSSTYALNDDTPVTKGMPVKQDKLPADILKALEAELKKVAEMYKDVKPGELGGGEVPPPPPTAKAYCFGSSGMN